MGRRNVCGSYHPQCVFAYVCVVTVNGRNFAHTEKKLCLIHSVECGHRLYILTDLTLCT